MTPREQEKGLAMHYVRHSRNEKASVSVKSLVGWLRTNHALGYIVIRHLFVSQFPTIFIHVVFATAAVLVSSLSCFYAWPCTSSGWEVAVHMQYGYVLTFMTTMISRSRQEVEQAGDEPTK